MAIWERFWLGKRNFEIDLVEFFASMANGESFEGAHHNAPPGRECQLPLTPKGYGLNSLFTQFLPEASAQGIDIDVLDAAVKPVFVLLEYIGMPAAQFGPIGEQGLPLGAIGPPDADPYQ